MPERKSKARRKIGTSVVKKIRPLKREELSVKHADSGQRLLQTPKRTWYKPLTWRNRPPAPNYKPLPKARKLFWVVLRQLWVNRLPFGGITLIYGLLNILLVRGLSGSANLVALKSTLDSVFSGAGGKLASSAMSFGYLLLNSGSSNTASSGIYQSILLVVCSLAFIWALRQVLAGHGIRIRDSFYQGMYPLLPFLLVFLLIGVQLLPVGIGGALYSTVVSGGIAVDAWEKAVVFALFLGVALWSLRMITATIFALYIVTLADMTPLRAYRSARQLVYGRRLAIWRKLIFLPVALLILAALFEVPLIMFLTPLAVWMLFIISMLTLPIVHSYLYGLYREML